MDGYRYLTMTDRKTIELMYALGNRPADIANNLNIHCTTIYKELRRGATGRLDKNQRDEYSAELAEQRLHANFKRRGRRPVKQAG